MRTFASTVIAGFLLASLAPMARCDDASTKLTPGRHQLVINAAGHEWTAAIHVPKSYDGSKPVPAVLILHGAGGNGRHYLEKAGWAKKADEAGFIAIAPDGLPARQDFQDSFASNPRLWNSGQLPLRSPRARIDDLAFIRALLDEVERRANVDTNRVYLTGHSNGAGMTYRLATEMPERFAAIAPVASQCWVLNPRPKRPLPTLFIIGTDDPLVPFRGGESTLPWGGKRYTPPVEDSLKKWARAISCSTEPVAVTETNRVRVIEFRPEASGALLRACFIEGHGHQWPGGRQVLPLRFGGAEASPLRATDVIWEFFEEQQRAASTKAAK
jgi:polyhydroxybutyrate depolymerase